jgi:hypothetical protein
MYAPPARSYVRNGVPAGAIALPEAPRHENRQDLELRVKTNLSNAINGVCPCQATFAKIF